MPECGWLQRADTTPVMLYGVSGVAGLSEGDARVRLAAAVDGAGEALHLPPQPGAPAESDHRLRLHQQSGHRLRDQTVAADPRQGRSVQLTRFSYDLMLKI